jgi:hypothetical protein
MKIEANYRETESRSRVVGRNLAEPFFVLGTIIFWAFALPIAALYLGVTVVVARIGAHLVPVPAAPRSAPPRLAQIMLNPASATRF